MAIEWSSSSPDLPIRSTVRPAPAALAGERAADGGGQPAAVGSVCVDVGIVDRDLQPHRQARGDGRAQDRYPVLPGKAVWARVVDGPHDRLVEDICVQVNPEPVRWPADTG